MKLLNKVNFRFLVLLLVVFSLTGVVLYFVLGYMVDDNIDHVLINRSKIVVNTIKYHPLTAISTVSPDQSVIIDKIPPTSSYRIFSDTTIFDSIELENIACRKIILTAAADSTCYKISITNSRVETEDLVQLIFFFMLGLFILIVFVLFFLNRKLSFSVWSPFFNTLKQLKSFRIEQKKHVRFEDTDISEFQQLNESLTSLLKKVQEDFNNLKEFTENASHEIQTPLAIIKSKIETILQDKSLTPQLYQQIQVALESVSRLSKLSEALLLLSKIENRQFVEEKEMDICELIRQRLEFVEELTELKKLEVTVNFHSQIVIKINSYLAEILINNLLNNALKHNFEGGRIIITSSDKKIIFSNTGIPLTVPPEKLFHRFIKHKTGSESTGLGLSIVSEICKNYGVDLQYDNNGGFHNITLWFVKGKIQNPVN
jgi:signal transduction histidine kinase